MSIRRCFLRAARPLSKLINKINIRIGLPPLRGNLYHEALSVIRPGDIILTRTKWRPTNIIFPGKWTHALIAIGEDELVEATLPVVRSIWLVDVWASASEVKIVRPVFLSDTERSEAASIAAAMIGTPYDLEFNDDPSELYCSELIYAAMAAAGGEAVPELRTMEFGELSIKPDAFDDPSRFRPIISSNEAAHEPFDS